MERKEANKMNVQEVTHTKISSTTAETIAREYQPMGIPANKNTHVMPGKFRVQRTK